MYWSRTGDPTDIFIWTALAFFGWAGGWLIASHLFQLKSRERMLSGLAIGMLLFIVLSNLFGQIAGFFIPQLPSAILNLIFGSAALAVLGLGGLTAWLSIRHRPPGQKAWFDRQDLQAWPQLLGLGGLLLIFVLINRGLAIFDDYYNLPIVSMIAAGDFPPHFHLNPDAKLYYHYGLNLFAASLMSLAGLFPWSAFDLSKAITTALAVSLAWIWFRRVTYHYAAAWGGALLILFAGGARWLLLFLPENTLQNMGSGLRLLGSALASGPDLYTLLISRWKIEGGGPFPFPFAFANGIFTPHNLALGGSGALVPLTLIVLLLLARRTWRPLQGLIYGLILASLALTAEHVLVLVFTGISIYAAGQLVLAARRESFRKSLGALIAYAWILIPAVLLAVFAGGVITETMKNLIFPAAVASQEYSPGINLLSLRWPPAITSSHLGPLSLTSPAQLLLGVAEAGIALFLAPLAIAWAVRMARRGQPAPAWLVIGSLISFVFSIFIAYKVERDTSRLVGTALLVWALLAYPLGWLLWIKGSRWLKTGLAFGYGTAILGGVVAFSIQLIAIASPQFTYFVDIPDAQISQAYWDRLEPDVQVFDFIPFRGATLFGRSAGRANQDIYTPFAERLELENNPDPNRLAQAGYGFVYLDKQTWQTMEYAHKQAFRQPCVQKYAEQVSPENDFRWLLDIRACR